MADPDQVLSSMDKRANFQRLANLLISVGTGLLREIFDKYCLPSALPRKLNDPLTKEQLKHLKLSKPQWDILYPSTGVYSKSADFDITLLSSLLLTKTICDLPPPHSGWDKPHASGDKSLAADLMRVRESRNELYAHGKYTMDISDDDFQSKWKEIREVLIRIAGHLSSVKKKNWHEAIDKSLTSPLRAEDKRNVEELEKWYLEDLELKKTIKEGFERVEAVIQKKDTATRNQIEQLRQIMLAKCLADATAESGLTEAPCLGIHMQAFPGSGPEAGATGHVVSQRESQDMAGDSLTTNHGEDFFLLLARRYVEAVNPSTTEEFAGLLHYLLRIRKVIVADIQIKSLTILVKCSSLLILHELWEDYRSGHLGEMVQKCLVTDETLSAFGVTGIEIETSICEEDYRACEQDLFKLQVCRKQDVTSSTVSLEGKDTETMREGVECEIPADAQDESAKGLEQPRDIDDTSDYFAYVETSSCGPSEHDIARTNMSENKAVWKCPRGSPILQVELSPTMSRFSSSTMVKELTIDETVNIEMPESADTVASMEQSRVVASSVQQPLQQNVDEPVPLKRKKKDSGAPAGKSVVVLKSCDVTIGDNYVLVPNTIEMARLKKKEKGQCLKNVQISSKMSQQDIKELLISLFPYLKDQRFYCASAKDNRTRLDFHGERRIWDGHLIKQKIKGNSSLYIFTDEGSLRRQDSSTHSKQPTLDEISVGIIKNGVVEDDDLEGLSQELGDAWEALARRLGFNVAEIQGLKHNNRSYPKTQLCMLQEWKQRLGRNATYEALYDALCHEYVKFEGLAETFCIDNNYAAETSTSFNSSSRGLNLPSSSSDAFDESVSSQGTPRPRGILGKMFSYEKGSVLDPGENRELEFKSLVNAPPCSLPWKIMEKAKTFICACLNGNREGIIYFGVGDNQEKAAKYHHGEIIGLDVEHIRDDVNKAFQCVLDDHIRSDAGPLQKGGEQNCINIHFVPVKSQGTFSSAYVIEIEVARDWRFCEDRVYYSKIWTEKRGLDRKCGGKKALSDFFKTKKGWDDVAIRTNGSSTFVKPLEVAHQVKKPLKAMYELWKSGKDPGIQDVASLRPLSEGDDTQDKDVKGEISAGAAAPDSQPTASSDGAKKRKGDLSTETKSRKTDSNPPEVDVAVLTNKELPKTSKRLDLEQLPIDILLLTVKDCEFLACLSLLTGFSRMFQKELGDVYIGNIGEVKIAVMKCRMGAAGPGSEAGVVIDAVKALTPKAVFCVGYCGGLQPGKVKLGDVVISEVLITYAPSKVTKDGLGERGDRVPLKPNLAKVILDAAAGWSAPLRDPAELEVAQVRGALLSGPQVVDDSDLREALLNRFPGAIAIEMEGEGVYSAAHDLKVEWGIIKGVSDFADGKNSEKNAWRPFASLMAASLVAHILSDPIIFEDWPHYNNGKTSLPASSGMTKPRNSKRKLPGLSPVPGTPVSTTKKPGNISRGPSTFRNTREFPLQKEMPTRQSPRKRRAEDLIGFAQRDKKRQKKDTYGNESDQGSYVQADSSSLKGGTNPQDVKSEQPRISTESSPKTLKSTEEQSRNRSHRPRTFKESPVHKVEEPRRRSTPKPRAVEEQLGIDVSFALDYSSSVSEGEFQEQVTFVKHIKRVWNISDEYFHLVVYGDSAEKIPFHPDNERFPDWLRNLKTTKWGGSQCRRMDLALTEAANYFSSDTNGNHRLIVLITAGKQESGKNDKEEDQELLVLATEALQAKNVKVILVPVGLETDFKDLGLIAKRPRYLFPLSSFDDLRSGTTANDIVSNVNKTVDLERYAKKAFEDFSEIPAESSLWENISFCSDVLEGAWYQLYDDQNKPKRNQKVKDLIRRTIDNFQSSLVTESKVCITVAVFGPRGVGKSFLLNTLLTDNVKIQNGPLPSAVGQSQTLIPIYVTYGRNVEVLLHKRETDANPVKLLPKEELGEGTLARVREMLEKRFEDEKKFRDSRYIEVRGPFKVFDQLKNSKMTPSRLSLDVDVEFVDVPGLGDETGDRYISEALGKADVVLFFGSGKSGRPVSAEDIAQIFRRRENFEFMSRPKLVHIVNDQTPASSLSATFDCLSQKKEEELKKAWNHLLDNSGGNGVIYQEVREKLPQLDGEDLLKTLSSESKAIYFHVENAKFLESLKNVMCEHVQNVKSKQTIHKFLQEIHWVAKKLQYGIVQRLPYLKRMCEKPIETAEVNFVMVSDMYEEEARNLIDWFLGKEMHRLLKLDANTLNKFLFQNFVLFEETRTFLLKMLRKSLKVYAVNLIEAFKNKNVSLLDEEAINVSELVEAMCLSEVRRFCESTAPAYLLYVLKLKSNRISLSKKELSRWERTSLGDKRDLILQYLSNLLSRAENALIMYDTREKKQKMSHFHLMERLKDVVQEMFAARSFQGARRAACLKSMKVKLPMVIEFCKKSIRDINPHPKLNDQIDFEFPLQMVNAKEDFKVPSESNHRKIIDEMMKLLRNPNKPAIKQIATKLKITDPGSLELREPQKVDPRYWATVLVNVLSDKSHFDTPLESDLILESDNPEVKKLLDLARKRLFAHEKSTLSCKLITDQNLTENEIHVNRNLQEWCLEISMSPTTCQTLDSIRADFTNPLLHLAPIFIPTSRPGPAEEIRGNYFLEEDPWSKISRDGRRDEEDGDREDEEMKKETSESSGVRQNIFLVVEKKDLITLQSTVDVLGHPKGSRIRLLYVVLPQNGRGIGVTRAIIKSLAEFFNFWLYWTIDDDIQFMYHFNQNDRKWYKCSINRALLFGQRVFQDCLRKTTKNLSSQEKFEVFTKVTTGWPVYLDKSKGRAIALLMDRLFFRRVQNNPNLLHWPFLSIPEEIRGDKEKEDAFKRYEDNFVEECTKSLFGDTINHIAGVSLAHISTRKCEYMSKYPNADYMPSEQRYQVILNNTCALKGKNFVTDEVIFDEEEDQVTEKDKRNTPYWGIRGVDKSFTRALKVSGVIGFQVIRINHSHKKLRNVLDQVGPSYTGSASPYRSEDEEENEEAGRI